MNIITITDRTLEQFRETCPRYLNRFIPIRRWLDEKKRTLPCFNSFGFDLDGNLYEKDFLGDRQWHFVKSTMTEQVEQENED